MDHLAPCATDRSNMMPLINSTGSDDVFMNKERYIGTSQESLAVPPPPDPVNGDRYEAGKSRSLRISHKLGYKNFNHSSRSASAALNLGIFNLSTLELGNGNANGAGLPPPPPRPEAVIELSKDQLVAYGTNVSNHKPATTDSFSLEVETGGTNNNSIKKLPFPKSTKRFAIASAFLGYFCPLMAGIALYYAFLTRPSAKNVKKSKIFAVLAIGLSFTIIGLLIGLVFLCREFQ